jgi:hypothetical protein
MIASIKLRKVIHSAIFLSKSFGTHSETKFGQRGILVLPIPGKKF